MKDQHKPLKEHDKVVTPKSNNSSSLLSNNYEQANEFSKKFKCKHKIPGVLASDVRDNDRCLWMTMNYNMILDLKKTI